MHSFLGTTAPAEVTAAVRRGDIAAFCLFAHSNIESPEQLRQLTISLHSAAAEAGQPPLLIGIDQEGGQMIVVGNGATELPGNMALGATRSPDLAEQAGRLLGRELLAMGINMNFSPSLDINNNPKNPVIGVRSFGDEPQLVSDMGVAMIRGLQAEGVIATAKHFPGHGDTALDSHYGVPKVFHSMERMLEVELAPFQSAIEAGVGAIMTAHVQLMALDDENPATLSRSILTELLRQEMGFSGLIITDAMDMHAVSRLGELESIRAALEAGVDLVLMGHLERQLELSQKAHNLAQPDSLERINIARQMVPTEYPSLDVVGCSEHQQIAQTIADRSITAVRTDGTLPLELSADQQIAIITIQPLNLTPADTSAGVRIALADAIGKRHPNLQAMEMAYNASDSEIREVIHATGEAEVIVIGTINADQDPSQAELVGALYRRGAHVIVVAMRTPYDLAAFPMIATYLCAYSIRDVTTEAIARVLFGEIEATGTLPCAIPEIDY